MSCDKTRGFTLIEMLVVIGVIGIIAAMLLPGLNMVRDKARTAQCQNNLRQLGISFNAYITGHRGQFPLEHPTRPGYVCTGLTDADAGWDVTHPMYMVEALCSGIRGDSDLKTAPRWRLDEILTDRVAICPSMSKREMQDPVRRFQSYAWNAHIDGRGTIDPSVVVVDMSSVFGPSSSAWPIPNDTGYCIMTGLTTVRSPSELCIIIDSADAGPTAYEPYVSWKSNTTGGGDPGLFQRHTGGANLLFMDGHVAWKDTNWLKESSNAAEWLITSGRNSGAWTAAN